MDREEPLYVRRQMDGMRFARKRKLLENVTKLAARLGSARHGTAPLSAGGQGEQRAPTVVPTNAARNTCRAANRTDHYELSVSFRRGECPSSRDVAVSPDDGNSLSFQSL